MCDCDDGQKNRPILDLHNFFAMDRESAIIPTGGCKNAQSTTTAVDTGLALQVKRRRDARRWSGNARSVGAGAPGGRAGIAGVDCPPPPRLVPLRGAPAGCALESAARSVGCGARGAT